MNIEQPFTIIVYRDALLRGETVFRAIAPGFVSVQSQSLIVQPYRITCLTEHQVVIFACEGTYQTRVYPTVDLLPATVYPRDVKSGEVYPSVSLMAYNNLTAATDTDCEQFIKYASSHPVLMSTLIAIDPSYAIVFARLQTESVSLHGAVPYWFLVYRTHNNIDETWLKLRLIGKKFVSREYDAVACYPELVGCTQEIADHTYILVVVSGHYTDRALVSVTEGRYPLNASECITVGPGQGSFSQINPFNDRAFMDMISQDETWGQVHKIIELDPTLFQSMRISPSVTKTVRVEIGDQLLQHCLNSNISMQDLGSCLGIPCATTTLAEFTERLNNITVDQLKRLSVLLHIDAGALFVTLM